MFDNLLICNDMGAFDFLKSSPGRSASPDFQPFVFYSNRHQRYEGGVPVYGLQECGRTFAVEKNVNGCDGYIIDPGVGYIVRATNDDTGRDQFAPKPMTIVSRSENKVELRGYMTQARTPFGYVDFDLSDYGLVVYYKDGHVDKVVFHMYDRNVYIEYMGSEERPGAVAKTDKYSEIIDKATFNPFNITNDPKLVPVQKFPDMTPVFKREIEETLDLFKDGNHEPHVWGDVLCGYTYSLLESYYKRAGYIPKVMMDEIIAQVFKALRMSKYASRFAGVTLIDFKDKMYHDLTTK